MVVFQYLSLLRGAPTQPHLYEEFERMADTGFRFEQKSSPADFTTRMSYRMQRPIPRPWLLSCGKLRQFDPKVFHSCLDKLRPENVLITVKSRTITENWDRKGKWYGTEYTLAAIPPDKMTEMEHSLTTSNRIASLHLPAPNLFIPTRFNVEKMPVTKPAVYPHIIKTSDLVRTWFKKDDTFWVPRASITILLRSPVKSLANKAKLRLFRSIILDSLAGKSYEALLAGLHYGLDSEARGLELRVSGYNEKLHLLLRLILRVLRDPDIGSRFAIVKERLERDYRSFLYEAPSSQLFDFLRLASDYYHPREVLAELSNITLEGLVEFQSEFLSKMHIECLVHGNLNREDALALSETVESILGPKALAKPERPTLEALLFPPGSNYVFEEVLSDPQNANQAIGFYIFIGRWADRALRARARMLSQITREPAFTFLRSKEQLGYIVYSRLLRTHTTMSFRVVIQSEKLPMFLDGQIEKFLASFAQTLAEMSETDFETHKKSCIHGLLEKHKNLNEERWELWRHIDMEDFEFNASKWSQHIT
jgi:insulysin